jgi:hypothetical protein
MSERENRREIGEGDDPNLKEYKKLVSWTVKLFL